MKIRIFALAKELGVDNKTLIDICSAAGIKVKNSALASITPEERDRVIEYMESGGDAGKAEEEAPAEVVTPTRPDHAGRGKVLRDIPSQAKVTEQDFDEPADSEETPETEAQPEDVPEVVADDSAAEVVAEAVDEDESASDSDSTEEADADDAEAQEDSPAEQDVAAKAESDGDDTSDDEPTSEKPDDTGSDKSADSGKKAVTRDDYQPASGGGSGTRSIPQMVPRGNMASGRRKKEKQSDRKPSMPAMAAVPQFTPKAKPKKKEEEAPAQRPDMKLTADMLNRQGPLTEHFKRNAERKASGDDDRRGRRDGEGGRRLRRDDRNYGNESRNRRPQRQKRQKREVELKTEAVIEPPITVRSLSEAIGRPAKAIQSALFKEGRLATINDSLEEETATLIALELGVDLEIKRARDIEDELTARLDLEDPEESLITRPPVVTILGHVDHGKTSLLDKIRESNVADGEAGGITQHIRAYQVGHNDGRITFVDTPGHAAFSEMRARGANVTDIVVLVVAADDGVMPQTRESIQHVKASGVPMIVAMNKSDLPDINEQRVLQELAAEEVLPAEWGGDTEVVRTSAVTGDGIDDLLETIQLTAEIHELKANPDRSALGVCIEAFQNEGLGVISWVTVQKGTLRVGDNILCGPAYGRVRAMYSDTGQSISEAGPSTPVKITGLDVVPRPGDHFFEMSTIDEARATAEERRYRDRTVEISSMGMGSKNLKSFLEGGTDEAASLPVIIKADTPGSLEALKSEMSKFEHPEVKIVVKAAGVGGVNESDVMLANATAAVIIAFQVVMDDRATEQADQLGIDVRRYSVIYEVTDNLRSELEDMLEPERREVATGRALVLRTFKYSKTGTIAGCRILNGSIGRNNHVHLIRDQTIISTYPIASLRREKDDVKEVREGMECGIRLEKFNDIREGDLLEAFRIDEIQRTLDSKPVVPASEPESDS